MKAVRLVEIGKALELQEIPIPVVGEKDVLVRVMAAGICHSDVHYRAGVSGVGSLPQTLGHEVAGEIVKVGGAVGNLHPGDRVAIHYMVTCGECHYCCLGNEQFCSKGHMIGKHRDGGYADYIVVPSRNAVSLPEEVPFEHAAVLMCSSSTSFHALRKVRLQPGETVAVFGAGGLGMSAIQLAKVMGALEVFAIDIHDERLKLAERYGANPVNATRYDPVQEIRRFTKGRGVNVALELVGLPVTMQQAVQSLAIFGRAGIAANPLEVNSYSDLIGREAEVIGCSDHLLRELPLLIEYVRRGMLDLSNIVTRTIPLDAEVINEALDNLQKFGGGVRTVITP